MEIIKDNFPAVFEKDVFNNRKLRNLVFDDTKELKKLEALIHPLLKEKLKQLIRKNSIKNEILFLDVALLFEMNWDIYCDYIIVADVDKNIQKQRVMKRDNVSETDFENIIKNQESQKIKKEKADIVINTGYSYGINKVQLIKFIEEIL
ncbi:MAG: dephospho-CoA kinase [Alphaproteobacteria bacterium]|nr:dephospho-CoA kinase [Alphaproteobacteria bacterium]